MDKFAREIMGGFERSVALLQSQLREGFDKLRTLDETIKIKEAWIEDLYAIQSNADSLSTLILAQKKQKEEALRELEEIRTKQEREIEETREAWQREQEQYKDSVSRRKRPLHFSESVRRMSMSTPRVRGGVRRRMPSGSNWTLMSELWRSVARTLSGLLPRGSVYLPRLRENWRGCAVCQRA